MSHEGPGGAGSISAIQAQKFELLDIQIANAQTLERTGVAKTARAKMVDTIHQIGVQSGQGDAFVRPAIAIVTDTAMTRLVVSMQNIDNPGRYSYQAGIKFVSSRPPGEGTPEGSGFVTVASGSTGDPAVFAEKFDMNEPFEEEEARIVLRMMQQLSVKRTLGTLPNLADSFDAIHGR
jgi:hypothetical protein